MRDLLAYWGVEDEPVTRLEGGMNSATWAVGESYVLKVVAPARAWGGSIDASRRRDAVDDHGE
jgi:hypothetical protein